MIKHKKVEAAEKPENVDYEMNKLGFEIRFLIGYQWLRPQIGQYKQSENP